MSLGSEGDLSEVQITPREQEALSEGADHSTILPFMREFFRRTLNFSLKPVNSRLGIAFCATLCYNSESDEEFRCVQKGINDGKNSGIASEDR